MWRRKKKLEWSKHKVIENRQQRLTISISRDNSYSGIKKCGVHFFITYNIFPRMLNRATQCTCLPTINYACSKTKQNKKIYQNLQRIRTTVTRDTV